MPIVKCYRQYGRIESRTFVGVRSAAAPCTAMHSRRALAPACSSPTVFTHPERCTKTVRSVVPSHLYRKLYRTCIVATYHIYCSVIFILIPISEIGLRNVNDIRVVKNFFFMCGGIFYENVGILKKK